MGRQTETIKKLVDAYASHEKDSTDYLKTLDEDELEELRDGLDGLLENVELYIERAKV